MQWEFTLSKERAMKRASKCAMWTALIGAVLLASRADAKDWPPNSFKATVAQSHDLVDTETGWFRHRLTVPDYAPANRRVWLPKSVTPGTKVTVRGFGFGYQFDSWGW